MPGDAMLDKPFYIALNISISISLILTLYLFEYFLRKAIFLKLEAEKQLKTLKEILENLPNPIIITKNKEITYKNMTYYDLSAQYLKDESNNVECDSHREIKNWQDQKVNISFENEQKSLSNDLISKKSKQNIKITLVNGT